MIRVRALITVALVLSMLGCDRVMSQRFRAAPAPITAAGRSVVRGPADSTEALRMLHGVAERHGLLRSARSRSGCTEEWEVREHFSAVTDVEFLVLCARVRADGALEVEISEGITSRWTPKGDSLRRALTDSLARFGLVPVP